METKDFELTVIKIDNIKRLKRKKKPQEEKRERNIVDFAKHLTVGEIKNEAKLLFGEKKTKGGYDAYSATEYRKAILSLYEKRKERNKTAGVVLCQLEAIKKF